jgi:hypothetical protein
MKLEHQQPNASWDTPPSSIIDQMDQQKGEGLSSPLIESLQVLEAAVDGLHRLGVAIRQSSSTSLTQRINSFIEKNDDGVVESLVLFLLKNQLVDRAKNEGRGDGAPFSLCKQLAVSISFRYFRVLYRRSHQKKLENKRAATLVAVDSKHPATMSPNTPPQRLGPPPRPGGAAPTPILPRINQLIADGSESAPTLPDSKKALQKYASSRQTVTGGASLVSVQLKDTKYPEPPKIIPPAAAVACPYCTHMLRDSTLKDKRLWE